MSDKYLNLTGLGTLWAKVKARLATKQDDISSILPTDASATNQLATKAYADAIGERLEARYLGSDANGNPFATRAALTAATAYYYQGAAATPDTNDITTVTSDEDHVGTTGEASTTRYRWNGTGWSFEYVINNTGLSEAQLLAVNSGITAAKVSGYDGLDARISAEAGARQATDALKLNVDGSNADEPGVIEILKQVPSGTATLSDLDNFLGCGETETAGDDENKKTVRRPVTDIWNYVKGKIAAWFGTVGSSSAPVYFSAGVPVACTDIQATEVPHTDILSGTAAGYGVYVGGATGVASTTRLNVSFVFSVVAGATSPISVYLGTFAFRGTHGLLSLELKSLNGTPASPWRIWYAAGKTSGTYNVGLWVIPSNKTTTYTTLKITKLHSNGFDWGPSACTEATYDELDPYARGPLRMLTLTYSSGGSNVTTTGGTWTSTHNIATIMDVRGVVDLNVVVTMNVINQSTYVGTLTNYEVTLVNSAGTEIIPSAMRQSAPMPKMIKYTNLADTASIYASTLAATSTHRFVFPISDTSNLLAGYRVRVILPSNYTINDQVNISVKCNGVIHPYDLTY